MCRIRYGGEDCHCIAMEAEVVVGELLCSQLSDSFQLSSPSNEQRM
jgi:hypothetical protein